jgi:inorganic pyrophosphatase
MRLGSEWLGRHLPVTIDRPLGSAHPDRPEIIYPVNYGYVPRTIADDGEPIDVYVIGEPAPLSDTIVFIVAIVRRDDDVEDKLVGCRDLIGFSPWEIMQSVGFMERWFDVTIDTLSGQAHYAKTP